jgi:hypothetical protein
LYLGVGSMESVGKGAEAKLGYKSAFVLKEEKA